MANIVPVRNDPSTGKFVKGNPGDPFTSKKQAIRKKVFDAVTPKIATELMEKLIALAKEGDREAIAMIFDRTIGKPVQQTEVNIGGSGVSLRLEVDALLGVKREP